MATHMLENKQYSCVCVYMPPSLSLHLLTGTEDDLLGVVSNMTSPDLFSSTLHSALEQQGAIEDIRWPLSGDGEVEQTCTLKRRC